MRFSLLTLMYVVAVVSVGMGVFGWWGILTSLAVLAIWGSVYYYGLQGRGWGNVAIVACNAFLLSCITMPDLTASRGPVRAHQCNHQMSLLSKALLLYEAEHGNLPPPCIVGRDGQPMHSWRVLILPYLDEQSLYERYDFNEPWNGPNNSALAREVPSLFQCPSDASPGTTTTNYFAVVGPQTMWPTGDARNSADATDGADQTLLIIEVHGRGVNWLQPQDIYSQEALRLLTAESETKAQSVHVHTNRFGITSATRNLALVDGNAMNVSIGSDLDTARALLTVAGGENVRPWIRRQRRRVRSGPGPAELGLYVIVVLLPVAWTSRRGVLHSGGTSRR